MSAIFATLLECMAPALAVFAVLVSISSLPVAIFVAVVSIFSLPVSMFALTVSTFRVPVSMVLALPARSRLKSPSFLAETESGNGVGAFSTRFQHPGEAAFLFLHRV